MPQLIFPVVGKATYFDDFGAARGQGGHQGNDLMTTWRSPAVAAEAGKVKFHTTSARAGCMLYLYGASGTTYIYIHLNNDLTAKNDNKGKCVAGGSYWKGLKDGARVAAGQPIGYIGDSGDADQAGYHLHFEVHPNGGAAVSPFPYLNAREEAARPGAAGDELHGRAARQGRRGRRRRSFADADGRQPAVVARRHARLGRQAVGRADGAAERRDLEPARRADRVGRSSPRSRRVSRAVAWTAIAPATMEAALGTPLILTTEKLVVG